MSGNELVYDLEGSVPDFVFGSESDDVAQAVLPASQRMIDYYMRAYRKRKREICITDIAELHDGLAPLVAIVADDVNG